MRKTLGVLDSQTAQLVLQVGQTGHGDVLHFVKLFLEVLEDKDQLTLGAGGHPPDVTEFYLCGGEGWGDGETDPQWRGPGSHDNTALLSALLV